ncbi:MAG TPA: hypothetical protein P5248_07995, partial [Bacteroidales bacterium]|nr:hypothetical protein [Bacteroidales bacterium]
MGTDLFSAAQNEPTVEREVMERDFYDEVMEKRQRPLPVGTELMPEAEPEVEAQTIAPELPALSAIPEVPEGGYEYEEAIEASTAYFKGDDLAAKVWVNKYALKDSQGILYERNPDEMHRRIARELARMEQKYANPMDEELIYSLLKDFRYIIPQGS